MSKDKLEKQLHFLQLVFPKRKKECVTVFRENKRNIRKTLYCLLQPQASEEELLAEWDETTSTEEKKEIIDQLLHHYCPNVSYTIIVNNLKKGEPLKLGTQTTKKLTQFRRAPRKEQVKKWLDLVKGETPAVIVHLLDGMRPFGRNIKSFWSSIDGFAYHTDEEVIKSALRLLAEIPDGVQKSIMTFARYCRQEKTRLYALNAMQQVYDLPASVLTTVLQPIVKEYRRLAIADGPMNDLWQEFKIIRSIYRNNGIRLTIPEIDLGRFS